MVLNSTNWYNYIIFDQYKTYVGSTVNLNRRIRQHNGEIKGGAKYTRGGSWTYYVVIYNLENDKITCLSEEWHIKWMTGKVRDAKSTYDRRKKAIEKYYPTRPNNVKPFSYILFVNKQYKHLVPKLRQSFIMLVDDFTMSKLEKHVETIIQMNNWHKK